MRRGAPEQEAAATRGPLFVVGPSRSGTTVLRELLNRHDEAWLARETHYFDDLRTRFAGRERARLDEADARRCADYFLRIGHRAYGAASDPEQSVVLRADLVAAADALGGGPDAYFEAFCRLDGAAHGRTAAWWGEKTPRHVFRISEMLAAFPSARVVCLIRDPRAVVASYRDWTRRRELSPDLDTPWAGDRRRARSSYHVVLASLMWRGAANAAIDARLRHGADRVFHLRYESLAAEPEPTVRALCDWLGLPFDPAMLDVPLAQSSYRSGAGARGISQEPLARWRSALSPAEVAAVQATCGGLMRRLGYELEPGRHDAAVAAAWASLPLAVGRAALVNRDRMGSARSYLARRARFSLGRAWPARRPAAPPREAVDV